MPIVKNWKKKFKINKSIELKILKTLECVKVVDQYLSVTTVNLCNPFLLSFVHEPMSLHASFNSSFLSFIYRFNNSICLQKSFFVSLLKLSHIPLVFSFSYSILSIFFSFSFLFIWSRIILSNLPLFLIGNIFFI